MLHPVVEMFKRPTLVLVACLMAATAMAQDGPKKAKPTATAAAAKPATTATAARGGAKAGGATVVDQAMPAPTNAALHPATGDQLAKPAAATTNVKK